MGAGGAVKTALAFLAGAIGSRRQDVQGPSASEPDAASEPDGLGDPDGERHVPSRLASALAQPAEKRQILAKLTNNEIFADGSLEQAVRSDRRCGSGVKAR